MSEGFIKIPISSRDGKDKRPVRIPVSDIADYREWLNNDGKQLTVFFFKKHTRRRKLIAEISVEEVDGMLNVVNANGQ